MENQTHPEHVKIDPLNTWVGNKRGAESEDDLPTSEFHAIEIATCPLSEGALTLSSPKLYTSLAAWAISS